MTKLIAVAYSEYTGPIRFGTMMDETTVMYLGQGPAFRTFRPVAYSL
jgi:hypothetical protein